MKFRTEGLIIKEQNIGFLPVHGDCTRVFGILNTFVANVIKNASRGKEYLPRTPVIHKNTSAVSVSRMPFIIL